MAHEGHAALPSKGLTVNGNQLLLSDGAREAIDLTTAKVTLDNLSRTVDCNARVELPWFQQAMVTTQVPGRITEVLVEPGDYVAAGDVLARVESLELESQQLAMLQADAELALARELFELRSSLAAQGAIAEREAIDAEMSLKKRTAALQIVQCKLRALGLEQDVLREIRSTRRPLTTFAVQSAISGQVANVDVRIGQQVETTEHLFHVVDLSTLWVVGGVLEADSTAVAVGQNVTLKLNSGPSQQIEGTIDQLRLTLDPERRTRAAVMRVTNPDRFLRPGMFGRMSIRVAQSREAVVCPNDAIIRDEGRDYVLLNRGEGKFIRQPIQLGVREPVRSEILEGLFPGDQVVTTGNHVLISLFGGDQQVQPVETPHTEQGSPRDGANSSIVANGVVELPTASKAFAGTRIEGRVGRVLVHHSQPVEAGDVLAEIESLELRNLQGEFLETETALAWTSGRVDRLSTLAEQRAISRTELRQLETDERVLSSKRDNLQRKLSVIGVSSRELDQLQAVDLSSEDCTVALVRSVPVRSPIDGTVADFDIVPGQIVDGLSAQFEIHNTSKVWVRGHVFQQDAIRVKPSQLARLTFTAQPGTTVEGRVVRIAPLLDSGDRVLPLWVEVDNPDGRLIEGMWARMAIDAEPPSLADGNTTPVTSASVPNPTSLGR